MKFDFNILTSHCTLKPILTTFIDLNVQTEKSSIHKIIFVTAFMTRNGKSWGQKYFLIKKFPSPQFLYYFKMFKNYVGPFYVGSLSPPTHTSVKEKESLLHKAYFVGQF